MHMEERTDERLLSCFAIEDDKVVVSVVVFFIAYCGISVFTIAYGRIFVPAFMIPVRWVVFMMVRVDYMFTVTGSILYEGDGSMRGR